VPGTAAVSIAHRHSLIEYDFQTGVHMKYSNRLYWAMTVPMAAFMLMASIPDLLQSPQAVTIFTHLGYPPYLLVFLGTAKILGVAAVLVPGVRRLKEWAFAGLAFDVTGALYSHLSIGDPPGAWAPAAIALALIAGSYVAYRARANRAPIAS